MSNLPGTNIIAAIAPFSDTDKYATHDAKYGKGGYRAVSDINARDNIPHDRRSIGMAVRTTNDNIVWILTSDDGTDDCENCVWVREVDTLFMDGGDF